MSADRDAPPPHGIGRRAALGIIGGGAAGLVLRATDMQAEPTARSEPMTVTCVIRYQIDPFQRSAFIEYARNWGRIIPDCGGHLIGYFLPYEGTNDIGWGLIAFDSLAAYEAYRAQLKAHPQARENLAMAETKRLILREERTFVEAVDGTIGIRPK